MKHLILICSLFFTLSLVAQEKKMSCCSDESEYSETQSATVQFAMLSNDPKFVSSHLSPLPFKFEGETGKMITYKTSDGKDAYAYEVKSSKPTQNVILMVHEWWGLNDYIKREAENLQKELGDVTVIALDLYDGKVATNSEEAGKLTQTVKDERAKAIISGAIERAGKDAKIGTIGWCFGGGWSLQSAFLAGKQAAACVMYYGAPEKNIEKLKTLNCKVLGIFGTQDKWLGPAVVAEFEKNMKEAGKNLTVHSYDADHAFANPSNPKFNKTATEDAHKYTIAFFKAELGLK